MKINAFNAVLAAAMVDPDPRAHHILYFEEPRRGFLFPVQIVIAPGRHAMLVLSCTREGLPPDHARTVYSELSRRINGWARPMLFLAPNLRLMAYDVLPLRFGQLPPLQPQELTGTIDLIADRLLATAIRADLLIQGVESRKVMDYGDVELLRRRRTLTVYQAFEKAPRPRRKA
jgi:hypothetical protein